MTDAFGTAPMFDQVPQPPIAKPYNDVSGGYGPIWYVRYKVKKPVKCDDCMGAHRPDPKAPHSRPAAYKRTQQGVNTLLLCHGHTRLRREQEAS